MKKTPFKLALSMIFFIFLAAVTGTSAWFSIYANINPGQNPFQGFINDAYYAYGTGAANNPYGITRPRHLYNLAWLQYLGFYNKANGDQVYFELGDNIDMSQYGALPPIGTELNPFVGHFDGHGYVVSGLTVSNDFDDYENTPYAISGWDNNTKKQPHVLGFFGVIGEYTDANVPDKYVSSTNAFINTGLTGITIKTVVKDSLMGIAAGYSSGILANVVVDASTLNVAKDVTLDGNTTKYGSFSNISDYTLVGYTTNTKQIKKVDETIYSVNSSSGYEFNGAEQGSITGWGGSIDMMSVTQRLQKIRDEEATPTTFVYNKRIDDYYDPNKTDKVTNVYTDSTPLTYLKNDNDQIGHYNFITASAGSSHDTIMERYALMGGGHWETHYNYGQVSHSGYKISNGNGHYLKAATFTTGGTNSDNAGTISDCDDSQNNPTTVWSVPASGSGYISTTYNYNYADNATTYYLYWTGSVLRLSSSTSYRTSFTREEQNGKVRFTSNNKYLNYNGSIWTLTDIPTILTEPELPVENPIEPEEPDYDSYLANSYQIAYNDGTNSHYFSINGTDTSSVTELSPSTTYGWKFDKQNNNGTYSDVDILSVNNNTSGIYIYTMIGETPYYIAEGPQGDEWRYKLTSNRQQSDSTAKVRTFTKGTSGNRITLKSSSSGSDTYYMVCNTSSEYHFQDRTTSSGSRYNTLTIATTRSILQAPYDAAMAVYNEQVDYRDNVYPGLKKDYDDSVAAYNATFNISLNSATISGPDEKVVNTTTGTGMHYEDDDVTYFPLSTMNDANGDYRPADNNTAYVVGGSAIKSNTSSFDDELTNVRFGYYPISGNISTDYDSSDGEFDHVYTIDNNLAMQDITSDSANYSKLVDCKRNLGGIMKNKDNVYGLHFMEASISMNAITTAKYVKVNRVVHENYELPVNSIDFHLKELGYISFMAGSYYQLKSGNTITKRNNSFFSLYQIERLDSSPTKINRILEVLEIYKHNSDSKNNSYVYKLTDGTSTFYTKPYKIVDAEGNKEWLYDTSTSYSNNQYVNSLPANYVLEFNCARIKGSSISSENFDKHVFFFQIPMNDGEFCLGSVEGAIGSYLMYLDIGANASKFQRSIFYEHFMTEVKTFAYPVGVSLKSLPSSFTSGSPVVAISPANTIDDSDSACVKIIGGYKDDFTIDRDGNDVALSRTSNTSNAPPIYQSENITLLHDKNSSTPLDVTHLSSTKKEYKRMTYVDINVNLAAATVTIITDVNINSAGYLAANRTIVQKIYSGKDLTANPSATYTYDASQSIDQRSSMRVYNTTTGIRFSDENLLSLTALPIADGNISNTTILTFRLLSNGNGGYSEDIVLNAVLDTTNEDGSYYVYNGYSINITPGSDTTLTITVKSLSSDKTIYITNIQLTAVNQVITLPIPQQQQP